MPNQSLAARTAVSREKPAAIGRLAGAIISIERAVDLIVGTTLGLLAMVAIVINVANALGRTLFAHPLGWSEEVLSYGLIWAVFLGSAVIAMRDEHIRIDFFSHLLPPALARAVRLLILLIGAGICFVVAAKAWEVVAIMISSGRRSVVVGVPMSYIHASVLIGFGLAGILGLLRAARVLLLRDDGTDKETPR